MRIYNDEVLNLPRENTDGQEGRLYYYLVHERYKMGVYNPDLIITFAQRQRENARVQYDKNNKLLTIYLRRL